MVKIRLVLEDAGCGDRILYGWCDVGSSFVQPKRRYLREVLDLDRKVSGKMFYNNCSKLTARS